jgi:hypothetical protein
MKKGRRKNNGEKKEYMKNMKEEKGKIVKNGEKKNTEENNGRNTNKTN